MDNLQKGTPFEVKLPSETPLQYGSLTKERFDAEIEKGISDIQEGRTYTANEVEAEMKRDYGI